MISHSIADASPHHGLFLVSESTMPVVDTQALANDIVARIEREFALTHHNNPRLADFPATFFQPRRETPLTVLRRVLNSINPFTFSA